MLGAAIFALLAFSTCSAYYKRDILENYLDKYCDQGANHICCRNELEDRYSCFGKNSYRTNALLGGGIGGIGGGIYNDIETLTPFGLGNPFNRYNPLVTPFLDNVLDIDNDIIDSPYTLGGGYDDIRGEIRNVYNNPLKTEIEKLELLGDEVTPYGRTGRLTRELRLQNDLENIDDIENIADIETLSTTGWGVGGVGVGLGGVGLGLGGIGGTELGLGGVIGGRKCKHSLRCQEKLEAVTDVAAQKVCTENFVTGGQRETNKCCRAGALVGQTVGRKHKQVCVPAVFKFQRKAYPCVGAKQLCKQVFIQCCHENAQIAREQNVLGRELIEQELDVPELFERRLF